MGRHFLIRVEESILPGNRGHVNRLSGEGAPWRLFFGRPETRWQQEEGEEVREREFRGYE